MGIEAAVAAAAISAGASLYGGKKNRDSQKSATKRANERTDAQTQRALVNLQPGYEQAMQSQQRGYEQGMQSERRGFGQANRINQEALERAMMMRGSTLMPQMQAYERGNVAAQDANLASLPAMRAAILGGRMPDMIQSRSLPVDQAALQGLINPTPMQFGQRRERPIREGGMRGGMGMQGGGTGGAMQGAPQMEQMEIIRQMQQEQMFNDRPSTQYERSRYEMPSLIY
tara:strand:- start:991 stop:1677 length:687 start_codon:yes stop_codon:yes gene_type:complete